MDEENKGRFPDQGSTDHTSVFIKRSLSQVGYGRGHSRGFLVQRKSFNLRWYKNHKKNSKSLMILGVSTVTLLFSQVYWFSIGTIHSLWLILSHFSIYVCIISMKEIKTNRREFKKSMQHDSMSTEYVHQSEYQTLTVPV